MSAISVIVPVFKVENYLRRCVDSILAQTCSDFELILVDDGSPDNCPALCDEYARTDPRVVVIHQENAGVSAARNRGMEWARANSSSEWLTFVDSDDWIHPQYLEALLHAAQTHRTRISVGGLMRMDQMQPMEPISMDCHTEASEELYLKYAEKIVNVSVCGKLFHKSCFEEIRFPVGKLWEDLATTYKLILAVPRCAVSEHVLYYYYNNQSGIIKRSWVPKRLDEMEAYEVQLDFLKGDPKWEKIHMMLQLTYIKAISYSYFMMRESQLSPQEKKTYGKLLSKKMRTALGQYNKNLHLPFWSHPSIYETAYPGWMSLYWHAVGISKKFKS